MLTEDQAVARVRHLSRQEARVKAGLPATLLFTAGANVTEDEAVAKIIELREQEEKQLYSLGETAVAMGDTLLALAPMGDDTTRTGALEVVQRVADRTDVPFNTLRDRRTVASRLPQWVRTHDRFLSCARYSVYQEIAHINDEDERTEWFKIIHTERPPDYAAWEVAKVRGKRKAPPRWKVDQVRAKRGVGKTRPPADPVQHVMDAPVEKRQEVLRQLVAQPEVLNPVVNDRGRTGVSAAETAFFQARAPYVTKNHLDFEAARQQSRDAIQQGMLDSPGLTNQRMIDTMDNRIRNDGQNYQQLARDIAEPMLQRHAARLEASRVHLQLLKAAVQSCIDALPDSPVLAPDGDETIIDAVAVEKIQRFAFAAASAVEVATN
jgi:hypothetical protein